MALTLVLVGGGKMGSAMLEGWIQRGTDPAGVTVVEPNAEAADALRERFGVTTVSDAGGLPGNLKPEVVVLAVKPQVLADVIPAYKRFATPATMFLSIAAGKTIGSFEAALGSDAAIVRAMPNTPAAVGRGATVGCPNPQVTNEQQRLCHDLLEAVGACHWVDDESLMDAVTAVSGSGPAYVFWLVECLANAGRDAGLESELAERLARLTVAGAGELLHQSAESAEQLRRNVTSPGGTTAAALEILMDEDGLARLMVRAVSAATKRSRQLVG